MPYSLGAAMKKVRNHNRTIVLNMVREKGPISKATIARNSGISFSTVNRVVDELLKENLVETAQDQLERGASGCLPTWNKSYRPGCRDAGISRFITKLVTLL